MKNKIGITEILGILGLSIWIVVILLRYTEIGSSNIFLFIRGVLPNFAAAWFMTMVFKIVLI
ncbi:MAG: hypothetical protein GXZ08_07405 [Tissierellia bacterium]|nr:hypothetical protein [Tissierellia bacterium]